MISIQIPEQLRPEHLRPERLCQERLRPERLRPAAGRGAERLAPAGIGINLPQPFPTM